MRGGRTYRCGIALVVFSVRAFFFNKKSRVDAFACEPSRVPSLNSSEQACDGARACKTFSRSEIEFPGASVRRCAGARTYRCGIALVVFSLRAFFFNEISRVYARACKPSRVLSFSSSEQACDGARGRTPTVAGLRLLVFCARVFLQQNLTRRCFRLRIFSRSEIEFLGASVRRCAGGAHLPLRDCACWFSLRAFFFNKKSRVGRPRRCAPLPASVCYNQAELRTRKRPSKRMD